MADEISPKHDTRLLVRGLLPFLQVDAGKQHFIFDSVHSDSEIVFHNTFSPQQATIDSDAIPATAQFVMAHANEHSISFCATSEPTSPATPTLSIEHQFPATDTTTDTTIIKRIPVMTLETAETSQQTEFVVQNATTELVSEDTDATEDTEDTTITYTKTTNGQIRMFGSCDLNYNNITSLAPPSADFDATNKKYVDTSLNNSLNAIKAEILASIPQANTHMEHIKIGIASTDIETFTNIASPCPINPTYFTNAPTTTETFVITKNGGQNSLPQYGIVTCDTTTNTITFAQYSFPTLEQLGRSGMTIASYSHIVFPIPHLNQIGVLATINNTSNGHEVWFAKGEIGASLSGSDWINITSIWTPQNFGTFFSHATVAPNGKLFATTTEGFCTLTPANATEDYLLTGFPYSAVTKQSATDLTRQLLTDTTGTVIFSWDKVRDLATNNMYPVLDDAMQVFSDKIIACKLGEAMLLTPGTIRYPISVSSLDYDQRYGETQSNWGTFYLPDGRIAKLFRMATGIAADSSTSSYDFLTAATSSDDGASWRISPYGKQITSTQNTLLDDDPEICFVGTGRKCVLVCYFDSSENSYLWVMFS